MPQEKRPIYLDNMATTAVDPRVVEKMVQFLGPEGMYGNPASITHMYGLNAAQAVDVARKQVAELIGGQPDEIIFTSGATEANNLGIIGAARFYHQKGNHLITMMTEHKAVLDSFQQLEKEGFEVTYLPPNPDGLLDLSLLEKAIRPETILVSIMHVNNEIGVIQDIASIGDLLKNKGIIFHVDAAQSAGKLPLNLQHLEVDLMSFSAHKIYGPKGVGALFVRQKPRIRLQPLSFGGGHERGVRSGTLATHQIAGMGEAFAIAGACLDEEQVRIRHLRERLWQGIQTSLSGVYLNGHATKRVAGNLNVSFSGVDGDSLLLGLHELAVSKTSACTSASVQPSYVLKAIGVDEQLAYSTIRFSLGRFTTAKEIDFAISVIAKQVARLRDMAPL